MSNALPGTHYCTEHQGNHSHYDKHNCELCCALAERDRLRELLREAHELFSDDLDHLRKVPTCKGAVMLARIDTALGEEGR